MLKTGGKIMIDVSKIRKAKKILEEALLELKTETSSMVEKSQSLDGVYVINNNAASVSFSALVSNNSWSPSTYLPARQVEAVNFATRNITDFDSFVNKIKELIQKKEVKIKNEVIRLNKSTINSLNCVLSKIS